ncbi:unnamed protein product [Caenorhabditis angaria]|uniref:TMEM132 domain-containing protein n=1 Tax=Caenorhabditis angaria TaxID=860376 RepID=A0A9P1IIP0_9PELO|nr:unnamed protein product [Caenorhabditis angaria]
MLNILVLFFVSDINASFQSITFSPADEAFLLYHGQQNTNFTSVFVQDGCPNSRNLRATVHSSDQQDSARIFEQIPLHCAAKIRIVTDKIDMERPYVDVLAVLDESFSSHLSAICIHVQITSQTSANELGSCVLNSKDDPKSSCIARVPVPFSWFPQESNKSEHLSVSYTISEKCDQRFNDIPQNVIEISSRIPKQKVEMLANETDVQVTLRTTANQSFSQNSMQSMFLNLNTTKSISMEIRVWIDSRVSIETIWPSSPNWTIRVSSANRPLFYTSLICTPKENITEFSGNIIALLIKMTSSSEILKDDVILHWHVIFDPKNKSDQNHKVATKFNVVSDEVAAVVVVPKRYEIMNLAVISGQQITSSMRIFTVSIGSKIEDVTALSHCISADAKILKTSPTCTSVYVDGSESSGSSNVQIYAHYLRYTTFFSFRVWYPKLPLTIWTSSSTLYAIKDWKVGVWRDLLVPTQKTRRAARQFSCANRFQQSEIRVLASLFMEGDSKNQEELFLSSHRNILFDVTNIVHNTLQIANRTVVSLRFIDGKAIITGENLGSTKILIRNIKNTKDLASEPILVHPQEVQITGLTARPICQLHIRILPILFDPAFFKIEVNIQSKIERLYQQCSIDSIVSYSDSTWQPLNYAQNSNFELKAHSTDDRSLAVSHHSSNIHIIAINDINPQKTTNLEIELLPSNQCSISSNYPLSATVLTIPINIPQQIIETATTSMNISTTESSDLNQSLSNLPDVPMHIFLLTIFVLIILFILISFVRRSAAFKGYEQLVAPLLSRLSSSSGSTRHEDTNEWVWLSQPQPPTSTLGSDYSDKSRNYKRASDDPNRTSISYHGSEISVFIAPSQANVMVNSSRGGSTRHTIVDSNSDHNLARIIQKDDKWNNDQFHTWTWKQRDRMGSAPIRESVA